MYDRVRNKSRALQLVSAASATRRAFVLEPIVPIMGEQIGSAPRIRDRPDAVIKDAEVHCPLALMSFGRSRRLALRCVELLFKNLHACNYVFKCGWLPKPTQH